MFTINFTSKSVIEGKPKAWSELDLLGYLQLMFSHPRLQARFGSQSTNKLLQLYTVIFYLYCQYYDVPYPELKDKQSDDHTVDLKNDLINILMGLEMDEKGLKEVLNEIEHSKENEKAANTLLAALETNDIFQTKFLKLVKIKMGDDDEIHVDEAHKLHPFIEKLKAIENEGTFTVYFGKYRFCSCIVCAVKNKVPVQLINVKKANCEVLPVSFYVFTINIITAFN